MTKDKATHKGMDTEAVALSKIVGALTGLQSDAQLRILRYAAERFSLGAPGVAVGAATPHSRPTGVQPATGPVPSQSQFTDAGGLLENAQPKNGVMRALVVGYWFQVCQAQQNFTGQQANDVLKELGHPSANITVDMNALKNRKPALVQQVAKSGKAQQARKKYRLTRAGIAAVDRMLGGQEEEGE